MGLYKICTCGRKSKQHFISIDLKALLVLCGSHKMLMKLDTQTELYLLINTDSMSCHIHVIRLSFKFLRHSRISLAFSTNTAPFILEVHMKADLEDLFLWWTFLCRILMAVFPPKTHQ